ncbi:tetratricopeptide repeat protein [Streptomyces sp. NBC_00162]|uniref:tetratricopeptide repeat protein n=1 Tax=Streptomyces sp. NBC_00162 TaxID=2903629 RepID=UPI00214AED6C|nr:tetratricopeptide repeat protein [Streptomyces sp. NBC_00162]UUU37487.1 hypothetical protein JIW86_00180 [Streptomyces sp. NBC_00162]
MQQGVRVAEADKRKGRPWGAIRPVNPSAGKLAAFLRAQVEGSGKTLAVLEKEINYSTTQISSLLSGRIPPQPFVTALIGATVPAQLRERRQSEADGLLYDAMHPPRTAPARGLAPTAGTGSGAGVVDLAAVQAQQIETYDRLTRALEQQAELRQAADNSARLIWILLGMIHNLTDRVHTLTRERDHAAGREVVEAAQAKLARAQSQQAKAESELTRAEEKKQQAVALSARLQEQITALTDELDRLRGQAGASHERLPDLAPLAPFAQKEETSADPEADDIDAALARVSAVNDTDDDTVYRITTELGDTAPFVPDNPLISADVPNKTAEQLRVEAAAASKRGDFQEAARLYGLLATASASFLGPDHLDTLDARDGHAACLGDAGDPGTARDLYADLTADRERVLGLDHPDTLISRYQHAYYVGDAGDPDTARDLMTALIADESRVLGPDHPDTRTSRSWLASSMRIDGAEAASD